LVDLFELSSQAVHDILPYLTAPWNTSYVLFSTKQDKVCKAKKDTTHKHTINTYYEELGIPKMAITVGLFRWAASRFAEQINVGQFGRRTTKINLTQM